MRMKTLLLSTSLLCVLTTPVLATSHEEEAGRGMMWKQMDGDGDSRVSKAEFMKSAEQRFDKTDANHDGYIDQSEREKVMDKMHERMKQMKEHRKEMMSEDKPKADME